MGCRATLAVMFFIISVGFNTFTVPGCKTGMYYVGIEKNIYLSHRAASPF